MLISDVKLGIWTCSFKRVDFQNQPQMANRGTAAFKLVWVVLQVSLFPFLCTCERYGGFILVPTDRCYTGNMVWISGKWFSWTSINAHRNSPSPVPRRRTKSKWNRNLCCLLFRSSLCCGILVSSLSRPLWYKGGFSAQVLSVLGHTWKCLLLNFSNCYLLVFQWCKFGENKNSKMAPTPTISLVSGWQVSESDISKPFHVIKTVTQIREVRGNKICVF